MRRPLLPLLILLLLQALLAGGLYLRRDPLAATRSDARLLPADAVQGVDQLTLEGRAESKPEGHPDRVVLQQKDGAWVLPENFGAPADGTRVKGLLDQLAGLKRGLPIATSEAAQRRFKVTDGDFERRVVLSGGGKALATVYFGSSPGLRKSDARTASDRAVYAVDMPTYELPTDAGSWLSPDLLRVDAAQLAGIGVTEGRESLELVRQKGADKHPDTWTAPELKGAEHLDDAHVAALVQQVASLRADAVLGTAAQPEWQQEHPALTLLLRDGKSQEQQWVLSKPSAGDFYVLKTSGHPWYFSISSASGRALADAAARSALVAAPVKH